MELITLTGDRVPNLVPCRMPLVILILFSSSAISSPLSLQPFFTVKQSAIFLFSLSTYVLASSSSLPHLPFPPWGHSVWLLPCSHTILDLCSHLLQPSGCICHVVQLVLLVSSPPSLPHQLFLYFWWGKPHCFQSFSLCVCVGRVGREGGKKEERKDRGRDRDRDWKRLNCHMFMAQGFERIIKGRGQEFSNLENADMHGMWVRSFTNSMWNTVFPIWGQQSLEYGFILHVRMNESGSQEFSFVSPVARPRNSRAAPQPPFFRLRSSPY